ncbi:hypothetical protein D3C81_925180 [compost metagenome]
MTFTEAVKELLSPLSCRHQLVEHELTAWVECGVRCGDVGDTVRQTCFTHVSHFSQSGRRATVDDRVDKADVRRFVEVGCPYRETPTQVACGIPSLLRDVNRQHVDLVFTKGLIRQVSTRVLVLVGGVDQVLRHT